MVGELGMALLSYAVFLLYHLLILQGGPFSAPMVGELGMALLSYAVFLLYHLLILQPVALLTRVNLDFVMCPAPNDPFHGPNYLLHHIWIQAVLIISVSQAFSLLLNKFSSKSKPE